MFYYFGYGSNLDLTSLRAKGVVPKSSQRASLVGWKLLFNVRHWFPHEGGVANICCSDEPSDCVQGLVHLCEDEHLNMLDAVESYGVAYDRIEVTLETQNGPLKAITYTGLASYINEDCLPTQRYLNILLKGANAAGLSQAYIDKLGLHPLHPEKNYPLYQHPDCESLIFNRQTLSQYPSYTALGGAVFDMAGARQEIECLQALFGGKDVTLFHVQRHDSSDGSETLDDIINNKLTEQASRYLNTYMHIFSEEFRYIGRYHYE